MSEIFSAGENLKKAILNCDEYNAFIIAKKNLENSPQSRKTYKDFMAFHGEFKNKESTDFNSEKMISFLYSAFVLDEIIAEYVSAGKGLCAVLKKTEQAIFQDIYSGL